jgi:hypothetical protein
LILSWRNFSKALTSKILSLAGCEALMMNCANRQMLAHFASAACILRQMEGRKEIMHTLLVTLACLPLGPNFYREQ